MSDFLNTADKDSSTARVRTLLFFLVSLCRTFQIFIINISETRQRTDIMIMGRLKDFLYKKKSSKIYWKFSCFLILFFKLQKRRIGPRGHSSIKYAFSFQSSTLKASSVLSVLQAYAKKSYVVFKHLPVCPIQS